MTKTQRKKLNDIVSLELYDIDHSSYCGRGREYYQLHMLASNQIKILNAIKVITSIFIKENTAASKL